MITIADEFKRFMEKVHPDGVPQAQWDSMQMAFYAGATVVITEVEKAGDREIPEDYAVRMLERIDRECKEFGMKMVAKGKSE